MKPAGIQSIIEQLMHEQPKKKFQAEFIILFEPKFFNGYNAEFRKSNSYGIRL